MSLDYQLLLGDCLEAMPGIPAGSVDAIIADWPYGTTACEWDSVIPLELLWKECKRVIKKNGAVVLTAASPFNYILWASNPKWFRYEWVWCKNQVSGIGTANKMPMKAHEVILVFYNRLPTFNKQFKQRVSEKGKLVVSRGVQGNHSTVNNRQLSSSVPKRRFYNPEVVNPQTVLNFECVPNGGGERLHPTQKPVALMEYLIKTYTNPGDLVLDNTMGSGSTGEACLRTRRRFIGIEKDEEYFEIAKKRLESLIELPEGNIIKVKNQEQDISLDLW